MLVNQYTQLIYTHEKYTPKNSLKLTLAPLSDYFLLSCEEAIENNINAKKLRYRDGEFFDNMTAGVRNIELTGFVRATDNRLGRERIIKTVFDIGSKGVLTYRNKQSKLEFNITCAVENMPEVEFDGERVNFTINLVCHNPYWQGRSTILNMATTIETGYFPLIIPAVEGFIFGYRTTQLESVFDNDGDVTTGAIYTLAAEGGTVTNPVITHVAQDASIKVFYSLKKDEKIVITSMPDDADVVIHTQESIFENAPPISGWPYLTDAAQRRFFMLEQGENLIRYNAETNVTNLFVSAEFIPLYKAVFK